ncbi:hypothetical protein DXT99_25570 [Pontibacter diazotrophicus]|uniref:DUF4097 domain-containing protein n=2 Tax=Pontibacter diazotrophicus TaxID=1400979 RepID=A0A3D8L108_9BACT|nr:hypothetical protein DXT99_25570 [Pontibacter diazotrophicus]
MVYSNDKGQEAAAEQNKPLTHRVKLANNKDSRVIITMFNSGVQVVGHNSDEVIIESSDAYEEPPARAKGLKPLYNQSEDNTGFGLAVTKENNTLRISKASRQDGNYVIRVPRNAAVVYEETNWTGDDVSVSDTNGEIELKLTSSNANLTNVSGPVIANTTAGDIVIKFSSLNQTKPSAISSVAGAVDVTLPANTKTNLKLKSIQGEIYSDFDMNLAKNNTKSGLPKVAGGNTIEGTTNGGGVEMSLYTITGDMFIRKSK